MASLWRCMFGPRLNRILTGNDLEGRSYKANFIEYWSDGFIRVFEILWSCSFLTGSVVVPALWYRRESLNRYRLLYIFKFCVFFGVAFIGSFCFRGIGRYTNSDYRAFIIALHNAQTNVCQDTKKILSDYDFCFWALPIDFKWNDVEGESKKNIGFDRPSSRLTVMQKIRAAPCQLVSYVIATVIGRRLLYPGSLAILQFAMGQLLLRGRLRLLKELNAERFKLLSRDHNEIDVVVVDRRRRIGHEFRDILVICCEGNAGFYEAGIMDTPLKASYSVLGWNHPGFGGSTGEPFPEQEKNAIDVVIQFAIHRLGFQLENIILYAWSIGGYPATWAASVYPDLSGLVLDATFDDVLPLALSVMPQALGPIVSHTIRDHLNLVNGDQLCQYPGPVLLVRRTKDEVITTNRSDGVKANRGNFLLIKLLQYRYPKIFNGENLHILNKWLSLEKVGQTRILNKLNVDEDLCETLVWSCASEEQGKYPSSLGEDIQDDLRKKLAIFLASKYMINFDSQHCQPLPANLFVPPWRPTNNSRSTSPFDRILGEGDADAYS